MSGGMFIAGHTAEKTLVNAAARYVKDNTASESMPTNRDTISAVAWGYRFNNVRKWRDNLQEWNGEDIFEDHSGYPL